MAAMVRPWLFLPHSAALIGAFALSAQLPPSESLSLEDAKGFHEELYRLESLLSSANDKCSVEFQIARTYAAGAQYPETIHWLRKIVDSNVGFDPSRDLLFANLRATREFQVLLDEVRTTTPMVSHSYAFATIPESDLFPENFAYDPPTGTFFLGSTFKNEIVRCRAQRSCDPFVPSRRDGLGYVLGLKIHRPSGRLWATSNEKDGASLRCYRLASAELIHSYRLPGTHLFNDLAISSDGEVFVTDTKEGSVYKLARGTDTLARLAPNHVFTAANGVALSPDGTKLYVADFGDGIAAVDLHSESVMPLPHPAGMCLAYIDGLYAARDSLIAIQNGPMLPRIVRFLLARGGSEITGMAVLERRNPLFDGITTGVLSGDHFYYIANPQTDKLAAGKIKPDARLNPLQVLAIDLQRY